MYFILVFAILSLDVETKYSFMSLETILNPSPTHHCPVPLQTPIVNLTLDVVYIL